MEVSPHHTMAGEICGFFTWLWVFYRAKHDLPVVLGLRHPWEHGEDPWAIHDHVDNLEGLEKDWEEFAVKSSIPGEDDDDDDDDDDDVSLYVLQIIGRMDFPFIIDFSLCLISIFVLVRCLQDDDEDDDDDDDE